MSQGTLAYEEALRIVLTASTPLPSESCAMGACLGRVLAAPIVSQVELPPFDNSAMDGFALRGGDDVVRAGSEWNVEGQQAAGDGVAHAREGAWEIMTGARMPDGLDRVVPVEQTERTGDRMTVLANIEAGQNVRTAGSDVRRGETMMEASTVVSPSHLMLLAALGLGDVSVAQRPRVAVLCTGRELVDDATTSLTAGQIRNSNGPFLAARVPLAGAELVHAQTVGDDIAQFQAALQRALEAGAQIVITTGAVSMGRYDFVPQALETIGATTLFHKVAIRPGKPLLFARLPNDALLFGLPGNPIAVAVGMRFFIEPALRVMLGLADETPRRVPLYAAYSKKPRLRFHLKTRLRIDREGRLSAEVLGGQESYRIRPLSDANAWTIVPADIDALPAGALVDVYGPSHLEFPLPCETPA